MTSAPPPPCPAPGEKVQLAKRETARAVLKRETDDIHRRIHRHSGLRALAAGTISRRDYRRLLARYYGFYSVFEPLIRSGSATELLRADMQSLGLAHATIEALPRCPFPRLPRVESARLGAAYVIEGAAFGGTTIAAAHRKHCGDIRLPMRFLTGDGAGTSGWENFLNQLEQSVVSAEDQAVAADAARATFSAFQSWLAGWGRDDG